MEISDMPVGEAVRAVLSKMEAGSGGMIAVDAHGNTSMQFTTGGMFRGVLTSEMSQPETAIY
jgi:isoaspartyl peptidase/L-asparaginase-like protein (Ntn-hydrolase superfamily)